MQTALDIGSFLVNGNDYTISFKVGGWLGYKPELSTVLEDIQSIGFSNATNWRATWSGGVFGMFGDQLDITFTYVGNGIDVVASMAEPIIDKFNSHIGESLNYIQAYTGDLGAPDATTQAVKKVVDSGLLPSSSSLWAIAVVVLLGAFLLSGGATATRRAIG